MDHMDTKVNLAEGYNPNRIRSRATSRAILAGVVAFAFVLLTFWLTIALFPFTIALPETYSVGEYTGRINWEILDGIASVATFSIVVGGVVFAFINYVQSAVQRGREEAQASFNMYREIYDRLMDPEAVAARRWVLINIPILEELGNNKKAWLGQVNVKLNKIPRGWKGERPPGKEYLKNILNTFDFIGFVAKHYWSMENELVIWMSPSIAKVWERIEPYIEEEARLRHEPDYYGSAREFGRYCIQWRDERYPKANIIEDAT
jgi:hypothetical protein